MRRAAIAILSLVIAALNGASAGSNEIERTLRDLELPDGFKIGLFAHGLAAPRQIAISPEGTVFVGSRGGAVYALKDRDGDGAADDYLASKGFRAPNGVAFHEGDLFVGDISKVLVMRDVQENFGKKVETVLEGLPSSSHHGYRYIRIRDGRLYIGLGVPCNVCLPPDPELTGTIRSYTLEGKQPVTHAYGVRNSVGFDWHPRTGELWFTDNGRDWLGDDLPNDEINRVRADGDHFGFPHCHQGDLQDDEFDERGCDEFVAPELLTGPHVANLGMRFARGGMFPESEGDLLLVALHGSWNRSEKIGYAVYMASLDGDGRVQSYEPFIEGWLDGESVSGRPVDLAFLPDGSLLVSDDYAGAIYRVTYGK